MKPSEILLIAAAAGAVFLLLRSLKNTAAASSPATQYGNGYTVDYAIRNAFADTAGGMDWYQQQASARASAALGRPAAPGEFYV